MNTSNRYLNLDQAEIERQETLRKTGLQEIEPLWLPDGPQPLPTHLGWPVATMIDDTIIVVFSSDGGQNTGLQGFEGRPDCVTRSTDGGKTWSSPLPLSERVEDPEAQGPGMRAIGATEKGNVLISTAKGVFRSEDRGETWVQIPSRGLPPRKWGNVGPRIVAHPEHGLVIAAHPFGVNYRGDGADECFHLFVSNDEGLTWEEIKVSTPGPFGPGEPTAFLCDGQLAVFSRNHAGPSTGREGYWWTWSYFAQFVPDPATSALPLKEQSWNCRLTNIYNRRMDTPDACLNPVSGRIEAIIPKRNEGFPYTDNRHQTLSLWSIDPEAFFAGEANWRFDGVLLRSKGTQGRSLDPDFPPREGLHPAGTVIDRERNLQHIFFFAGDRTHRGPDSGLTGTFRLSRTLDTEKLRRQLRELEPGGPSGYRIDETFRNPDAWTLNGMPLGLKVTPGDRDAVRRTLAPLPEGDCSAGPEGLRLRTRAAGHFGFYHEGAVVFDHYTMTIRVRISRYPRDGEALGVVTNRGSRRLHWALRHDGIYQRVEREGPLVLVQAMRMDRDWHEWTVSAQGDSVEIAVDGRTVAFPEWLWDDWIGSEEVPLGFYVRTTDAADPAEIEVSALTLINHQLI